MCNDVNDLRRELNAGTFDPYLKTLATLISDRRKMKHDIKKAQAFANLQVGDPIRINDTANPKYLIGATGKVTEKRRTKVVVDLDTPRRKFHRNIVCPPTLLDVI